MHVGIMALPRAVATMGAIPGALLILFTYIVSFITMDVLSRCITGLHRLTTTKLRYSKGRLQDRQHPHKWLIQGVPASMFYQLSACF